MEFYRKYLEQPIDYVAQRDLYILLDQNYLPIITQLETDKYPRVILYSILWQLYLNQINNDLYLRLLYILAHSYDDVSMRGVISSLNDSTSTYFVVDLVQILKNAVLSAETTIAVFSKVKILSRANSAFHMLLNYLATNLDCNDTRIIQNLLKIEAKTSKGADLIHVFKALSDMKPDIKILIDLISYISIKYDVKYCNIIHVVGESKNDIFIPQLEHQMSVTESTRFEILKMFLERYMYIIGENNDTIMQYYNRFIDNTSFTIRNEKVISYHPLMFDGLLGPFPHVMTKEAIQLIYSFEANDVVLCCIYLLENELTASAYIQILAILFSGKGWFLNEMPSSTEDWGFAPINFDDMRIGEFSVPHRELLNIDASNIRYAVFSTISRLVMYNTSNAKSAAFLVFYELIVTLTINRPSLIIILSKLLNYICVDGSFCYSSCSSRFYVNVAKLMLTRLQQENIPEAHFLIVYDACDIMLNDFWKAVSKGYFAKFFDTRIFYYFFKSLIQLNNLKLTTEFLYKSVSNIGIDNSRRLLAVIDDYKSYFLYDALFEVQNTATSLTIFQYIMDDGLDLSDYNLKKLYKICSLSQKFIDKYPDKIGVSLYLSNTDIIRYPLLAYKRLTSHVSCDDERLGKAVLDADNLWNIDFFNATHIINLSKLYISSEANKYCMSYLLCSTSLLNPNNFEIIKQYYMFNMSVEDYFNIFAIILSNYYKFLTATSLTMYRTCFVVDPGYFGVEFYLLVNGIGKDGTNIKLFFSDGKCIEIVFTTVIKIILPTKKYFELEITKNLLLQLCYQGSNYLITINSEFYHNFGILDIICGDIFLIEFTCYDSTIDLCLASLCVEYNNKFKTKYKYYEQKMFYDGSYNRYLRQPPFHITYDVRKCNYYYSLTDISLYLEESLYVHFYTCKPSIVSIGYFFFKYSLMRSSNLLRQMQICMINDCEAFYSAAINFDFYNIEYYVFELDKCICANVDTLYRFILIIEHNYKSLYKFFAFNPSKFPAMCSYLFKDSYKKIESVEGITFLTQSLISLCYVEELDAYLDETLQYIFAIAFVNHSYYHSILLNIFISQFHRKLNFSCLLSMIHNYCNIDKLCDIASMFDPKNGSLNALLAINIEKSNSAVTKYLIALLLLEYLAYETQQKLFCSDIKIYVVAVLVRKSDNKQYFMDMFLSAENDSLQFIDYLLLSLLSETNTIFDLVNYLYCSINTYAKMNSTIDNTERCQMMCNTLNFIRYCVILRYKLPATMIEYHLAEIKQKMFSSEIPFVTLFLAQLSTMNCSTEVNKAIIQYLSLLMYYKTSPIYCTVSQVCNLIMYDKNINNNLEYSFQSGYVPFILSFLFENIDYYHLSLKKMYYSIICDNSVDSKNITKFLEYNDKFIELKIFKSPILDYYNEIINKLFFNIVFDNRVAHINYIKDLKTKTLEYLQLFLFMEAMYGFNLYQFYSFDYCRIISNDTVENIYKYNITYEMISSYLPIIHKYHDEVQYIDEAFKFGTIDGIKERVLFHNIVQIKSLQHLHVIIKHPMYLDDKLINKLKHTSDIEKFVVSPDKAELNKVYYEYYNNYLYYQILSLMGSPEYVFVTDKSEIKSIYVDHYQSQHILLIFIALIILFDHSGDEKLKMYVCCVIHRIARLYESNLSLINFGLDESMSQFLKKIRYATTYGESRALLSCAQGVPRIIFHSVKSIFSALDWDLKGFDMCNGFSCQYIKNQIKPNNIHNYNCKLRYEEIYYFRHYIDEIVDDNFQMSLECTVTTFCTKYYCKALYHNAKLHLYYDKKIKILYRSDIYCVVCLDSQNFVIHHGDLWYRLQFLNDTQHHFDDIIIKQNNSYEEVDYLINTWSLGYISNFTLVSRLNAISGLYPGAYPKVAVKTNLSATTLFSLEEENVDESVKYVDIINLYDRENVLVWVDGIFGAGRWFNQIPQLLTKPIQIDFSPKTHQIPLSNSYRFMSSHIITDADVYKGGECIAKVQYEMCEYKSQMYAIDRSLEFVHFHNLSGGMHMDSAIFSRRYSEIVAHNERLYCRDGQGIFVYRMPELTHLYWFRGRFTRFELFEHEGTFVFATDEAKTTVFNGSHLVAEIDQVMNPSYMFASQHRSLEATNCKIFDLREKLILRGVERGGFYALGRGSVVDGVVCYE